MAVLNTLSKYEKTAGLPMEQSYYIPKVNQLYSTVSPVQQWDSDFDTKHDRGIINYMSKEDINALVHYWEKYDSGSFYRLPKGTRANSYLETWGTTNYVFVDKKIPPGESKHPQVTVPIECRKNVLSVDYWYDIKGQIKILRHLVVWRYYNDGALIPTDLDISHCDNDSTILNLVAETPHLNESRKYCHKFGWYKKTDGNGIILCPHRSYHACT